MRFGWCSGFVTGEAGFNLHYNFMQGVIETNIPLGGREDKITVFCGWIGEYGIFVLGQ